MKPEVQLAAFGNVAQTLEPVLKGLLILQVQGRNEAAESVFPANGPETLMGFSLYHP